MLSHLSPLVPHFQVLFPEMGELGVLFAIIGVLYLIAVHGGRAYFKNREPLTEEKNGIETILFWWNMGHSLFSFVWLVTAGMCVSEGWSRHGMDFVGNHTWPDYKYDGMCRSWGWVYLMSKIVEFGDTAFLIARKKPVPLLHWVHHYLTFTIVAVWHSETNGEDGLARVAAAANVFVHTLMYMYYGLKAKGYEFPKWYPRFLTTIQIIQMTYLATWVSIGTFYIPVVSLTVWAPYFSMVMLFLFLFVQFYLQRYVWKTSHHKKKKKKKKAAKAE